VSCDRVFCQKVQFILPAYVRDYAGSSMGHFLFESLAAVFLALFSKRIDLSSGFAMLKGVK